MPIYDILQFYGIRGARVGAADYQCNIKDKKIVCDIKNFFCRRRNFYSCLY
ncbi:TPA: hypothetical protein R8J05_000455 [Campylobacter jejuni]|nr:hypothetical protein [Campylobacter jejuni]